MGRVVWFSRLLGTRKWEGQRKLTLLSICSTRASRAHAVMAVRKQRPSLGNQVLVLTMTPLKLFWHISAPFL